MVVVDNVRRTISQTIDIVVRSVRQTAAGTMMFGRDIEAISGPAARPQLFAESESAEVGRRVGATPEA